MVTVAEVLEEYDNRKRKPKYARIGVINTAGEYRVFANPTNIKEHFDNNGILEFDASDSVNKEHVEMCRGVIVDKFIKLE